MLRKSPPQKSLKLVASRETLHSLNKPESIHRPEWLRKIQGGNSPHLPQTTIGGNSGYSGNG
jgi:hypothetical protein